MLLVGDIGGTKTLLAAYSAARGAREPLLEAVFRSADYADLESLIAEVAARVGELRSGAEGAPTLRRAILAVAGPVIGGRRG